MRKQKIFRPVVAREVYTRQAIESAWPSGDWVEETPEVEAEVVEVPGRDPGGTGFESQTPLSNNLTIIGDLKDLTTALLLVGELSPDQVIVGRLPSGRGAESKISKALEGDQEVVHVDSPLVEAVMSHDIASPVLLLGNGTRVKEARSWLGRANWNREVHEL